MFAPGLVFALRKSSSFSTCCSALSPEVCPVSAFLSQRVACVFNFPNNTTDAIVHLVTAAVMIAVAVIQIRLDGGLRNSLTDLHTVDQFEKRGNR